MIDRRITAILLLAAILTTALGATALELARWNAANLFFTCSQHTTSEEVAMRCGRCAVSLYEGNHRRGINERMRESSRVVWSSASTLGMTKAALDAFTQWHDMNPHDCIDLADHYNAVNFSGVQTGGLNVPRRVDGRIVALMFSSQPISQPLCMPESGLYRIDVVARDDLPSPIEIEILLDDWVLGTLSYKWGTQRWITLSLQVALPEGEHLMALRFANDFADAATGVDRNALIDTVRVTLLP